MTISIKRRIKQQLISLGIRKLPDLDANLINKEHIFKSPPFTKELVEAIHLIAPQFDLTTSDKSRIYWESNQNGACWGEYEALTSLFKCMPVPHKVLEIGPGLGRSLVFLNKKLGLQKSEIHAFEGNGKTTKYTILGPRFDDSFCGNIEMLQKVLKFNNMNNVKVFNASDTNLKQLPGPYDLIYSFYSIGFHWSLEHFIDDILQLMSNSSVAIFTVPNDFEPFPALNSINYKVITWETAWPKGGQLKLLIIGKQSIPGY